MSKKGSDTRRETAKEIRKENKLLRRGLLIAVIVFIVLFGGLLGYMLFSYSWFNLVRVQFSPDYVATENATISFYFVGSQKTLPNGTISGGDFYSGGANALISLGNFDDESFREDAEQKVIIPVTVTEIYINILWVNSSDYPSSPQQLLSDEITLMKSQTITITSIDVFAGVIGIEIEETNFFLEILAP